VRLSEIKGDRVFYVIADIIDPIGEIACDKEAAALFKPKKLPKGMEPWQFFVERLRKSLPTLIRDHKDAFVKILASVNDVTPEEYVSELTLAKLISDVTELFTDKEFASFFG